MRFSIALLLSASLLFTALFAEEGGVVQEYTGEVTISGDKDAKVTAKKQKINFGDTIRTGKDAKAQLVLGNGEIVLLKESSSFKLTGKKGSVKGVISQGEFLIGLGKKLGKNESFQIETPACVAGVRGTLFWGLADTNKNSTYAALENQIEVTAQGKSLVLKPGEKTFVAFGKAPDAAAPSGVKPEYLDTFAVDGQIQGLKGMLPK